MNKDLKIAYMGTPDFAAIPLADLIEAGYDVAFVVTMPDRAKGRGKKMSPPPVKVIAQAHGIPVFQPEGKEDFPGVADELKKAGIDLVIVAAYGRILPKEILDLPSLGCINIHASLLPRHRGASPIQSAILAGDEETGVSLMYMNEAMDEGDVFAFAKTPMGRKTAGELFDELAKLGSRLLLENLDGILSGSIERTPQDQGKATYSSKIKKEDSLIDFSKSAEEISNLVRAMNPAPGARTNQGEKMLIITEAEALKDEEGPKSPETMKAPPGQVVGVEATGISIATGGGRLLIKKLKPAGKQSMEVSEYIKGNKIEIGEILG